MSGLLCYVLPSNIHWESKMWHENKAEWTECSVTIPPSPPKISCNNYNWDKNSWHLIFLHQGMFKNKGGLYIFSYIYMLFFFGHFRHNTVSVSLLYTFWITWTLLSDERRPCWCQSLCLGRREAGYVGCVSCFFPWGAARSGAQGSQHICSESWFTKRDNVILVTNDRGRGSVDPSPPTSSDTKKWMFSSQAPSHSSVLHPDPELSLWTQAQCGLLWTGQQEQQPAQGEQRGDAGGLHAPTREGGKSGVTFVAPQSVVLIDLKEATVHEQPVDEHMSWCLSLQILLSNKFWGSQKRGKYLRKKQLEVNVLVVSKSSRRHGPAHIFLIGVSHVHATIYKEKSM